MRCAVAALLCGLPMCAPAAALVGDAAPAHWTMARPTVMVTVTTGGACSGTVLAQDLVLTAAHCITAPADHTIVGYAHGMLHNVAKVRTALSHPLYRATSTMAADLALLKLDQALPSSFAPAVLSMRPVARESRVVVVGYGVAAPGQRHTAGVARMATLLVTQVHPDGLLLRDPAAGLARAKIASCSGDSGAPVFALRGGIPVLVGVVSKGSCGEATIAVPLADHQGWIMESARKLGSPLDRDGEDAPMR